MTNPSNIAAVILAAGASRRLGRPKQLLPFRGKTLLQYCMNQVQGVDFGRKLLVLGAKADEIQAGIASDEFEIIHNTDWEKGLSSSLHAAIQALNEKSSIQGILFLVCDQPRLDSSLLADFINTHQSGSVTVARYAGTYGVPMLIDRAFWPELLALEGDRGAKAVVKQHEDKLLFVDFPEGEFDVDRVEDVTKMDFL